MQATTLIIQTQFAGNIVILSLDNSLIKEVPAFRVHLKCANAHKLLATDTGEVMKFELNILTIK